MNARSAATAVRANITYLPVVPGRLEWAEIVRRYVLEHRPQAVAVELPSSLEHLYVRAIERLPQMSVIVIPNPDETRNDEELSTATYIPIEGGDPFVEALRSGTEIGAELVFLEPATHEKPHLPESYPDSYSVTVLGASQYVDSYRIHKRARTPQADAHAAAMAWKLQGTDPLASVLVVVSLNLLDSLLDAMEMPQEPPARGRTRLWETAELFNLHPDCLAEVTTEPPFYGELYEEARRSGNEDDGIDRVRWQNKLLREAEGEYRINTGDAIASWQRRGLARFTRNLAMLDGMLIPSLYDLTVGARSLADDNFAYEVWHMGNRFRAQQNEAPPLETINLSGEQIWLHTRNIRLRRRLPRMKQMWKPASLKERKREKSPGQWARETNGNSICSYPPEDLVIENYGRFLKRYAKSVVAEERSRVEPFQTSMLDGVDLRETIRNWHEGQLYVREWGKFSGEIGAVIIIFDEDGGDRYNYLTTWLGEHSNESDMAFYATHPFEHIVGPGIGRAEYGGMLMTLPPRRLYDIWTDPDYDAAESKAERLLMAGLDYSMERHVLYIAAKPPRSLFRQIANRVNRKIIYIPLGQLSPAKLKRIRVVHVLDSYSRRTEAKDYIW